jgi:hypothetical protein
VKAFSFIGLAFVSCCQLQSQNGALTPPPGQAVLILGVNRPLPRYDFQIAAFDPQLRMITNDHVTGNPSFDIEHVSDRNLVWKQVDPGTYVFSTFNQQKLWGLCFGQRSLSFQVAPGDKLYGNNTDGRRACLWRL